MALLQGQKVCTNQWGLAGGSWRWARSGSSLNASLFTSLVSEAQCTYAHLLLLLYQQMTQPSSRFLIAHTFFIMTLQRKVQNGIYSPAPALRLSFCLEFRQVEAAFNLHLCCLDLAVRSAATLTKIILNPDSSVLPKGQRRWKFWGICKIIVLICIMLLNHYS